MIFTNPDMLHCTILPMEEEWRRFFTNLKFVVVDGKPLGEKIVKKALSLGAAFRG